ncbi:MAG: class I SAM-dependent methyltransferase [Bacteroidota bacterium]|nr:class I SAM-dependent methyltransferase [Bacteroidota bacterium]
MSTKTIQGKLWSVAPQYWAQHFEPWFLPMYKKVLEQLKLTEDQILLDAGCGAGLFSSLAIKAGAQVIGVDAAPGLLEVAKERNPQNNFLEEDLETLPFADNSFDVVTGFNSFQYAGSFEKALVEAKRVIRPGGRLVLGIWDKPETSDATNVLKAIGTLLPPPPPGTPGPFALSEDGKIESHFKNNGLKLIYKTTVACPALYASLADGIKSFMGTGPAAAAVSNSNRQTVEETISIALQPYLVADDFHFLHNQFLVFIAQK